jgi:hypothetical protein
MSLHNFPPRPNSLLTRKGTALSTLLFSLLILRIRRKIPAPPRRLLFRRSLLKPPTLLPLRFRIPLQPVGKMTSPFLPYSVGMRTPPQLLFTTELSPIVLGNGGSRSSHTCDLRWSRLSLDTLITYTPYSSSRHSRLYGHRASFGHLLAFVETLFGFLHLGLMSI